MGIVLTVCEGDGDGAAEADAEGVSSRMGTAWRELRLARSGLLDALGERVMGGGGDESTSIDKGRQRPNGPAIKLRNSKVVLKHKSSLVQ